MYFCSNWQQKLTDRPESRTLVRLETLDEAYAVLLRGSLLGSAVQGLVMKVDIVQAVDVWVRGLDLDVIVAISLLSRHFRVTSQLR